MSDSDSKILSISIMQKEFQVACPADEEEALLRAARYLHEQMEEIRSSGRVVGLDRISPGVVIEENLYYLPRRLATTSSTQCLYY